MVNGTMQKNAQKTAKMTAYGTEITGLFLCNYGREGVNEMVLPHVFFTAAKLASIRGPLSKILLSGIAQTLLEFAVS